MQYKSVLTLKNYVIKYINFSVNEDFNFDHEISICITPEFTREITKIDNDNVAVDLTVCVENVNNNMPFSLKTNIVGIFYLENWEHPEVSPLILSNSVAILFPYLRAFISTITANANIPPYILPVMNIAAMFNQKTEDKSIEK